MPTWKQDPLRVKQTLQPVLDKWRGGRAMIASYAISHSTMKVSVIHEALPWSLSVTCSACSFLQGPVQWENCSLTLRTFEEMPEFALEDSTAGFHVRCCRIEAEEDHHFGPSPEHVQKPSENT